MNRLCAVLLLLLVALAPAAGQAAPGASGTVAVSGAYLLHFNLNLASTLPDGATITCKARIAPNASALDNGTLPAMAPVETATGIATVNGTLANCAVEIPFSWSVHDAKTGVSLSYEIVAVAVVGPVPTEVRTSARQDMAVAYPAPGSTESVRVEVTF